MKRSIPSSLMLFIAGFFLLSGCSNQQEPMIITVNGPLEAKEMGITLTHEHVLVDFIGADSINDNRWNRQNVAARVLPCLREAMKAGCRTFVECTPDFLGRDPLLLKILSDSTGMNILTNTGYYGAVNNKYLPSYAFDETAEELAARWIKEWKDGIGGTTVRPGFIKIGVGGDSLSGLHRKLVRAAALTHLATGLTIASHTGPAVLAFAEIKTLEEEGVSPSAFIWVHAQNEKDLSQHVRAAEMGAWVSFDGINDDNVDEYAGLLQNMKDNKLLGRVLLSHDAGWYHPGEPDGGQFRGYTSLFTKLVPLLKKNGFTEEEINTLLVSNPARAFQFSEHNRTGESDETRQ